MVVSGSSSQTKETTPKSVGADDAVAVSVASSARVAVQMRANAKQHAHVAQPVAPSSAPAAQFANPIDFTNMTAASIEAALKPLRKKMEATIIPMQRTIESLQAEFSAIREEKDGEVMVQPVSVPALDPQEAKRFRTGLAA